MNYIYCNIILTAPMCFNEYINCFLVELLNDADGETERGEQLLMMLIAVSDFLKVSDSIVVIQ